MSRILTDTVTAIRRSDSLSMTLNKSDAQALPSDFANTDGTVDVTETITGNIHKVTFQFNRWAITGTGVRYAKRVLPYTVPEGLLYFLGAVRNLNMRAVEPATGQIDFQTCFTAITGTTAPTDSAPGFASHTFAIGSGGVTTTQNTAGVFPSGDAYPLVINNTTNDKPALYANLLAEANIPNGYSVTLEGKFEFSFMIAGDKY